jgi:ankyrin repeat protein
LVVDASRQALPLEVAVSRQHDAMVDLLLSLGSIVPKQVFALSTNHNFPIRITRRLLQTDEFMEWAAESGNRLPSPVGLLERRLPLVYERDIIIMIRRLVQVGLDPTVRNSAKKTALHFAIAGGYQAVVVYLLLIGTPIPFDFISAVSRATFSERIPILRLIVDTGAEICVGDDTALHLAMKTFGQDECLEVVKILVGAGCKPFVYNPARKTPLHLALEQRYFSVADYLLLQQAPAPLDALSAAMDSGYPTIVHTLINGGADIHGVTAYGDGLLHRAVISLDEHQVQRWLNSSSGPVTTLSSRMPKERHLSILHWIASFPFSRIIYSQLGDTPTRCSVYHTAQCTPRGLESPGHPFSCWPRG